MLTNDKLEKIALDECINMIGENFVMKHKEFCCASYGIMSDGLFHYNLGMDTRQREWQFGGETPMEFYAFVVVNPKTGQVTRDYDNSTLPNQII